MLTRKGGEHTSKAFRSSLMKSHAEMGEGPIHLLFDSYSVHRTDAVREITASLGITLHFIPPGPA
jgi:transposase